MKVAVAQFYPVFKDRNGNLAVMEELVFQASSENADIIVFPEMATCGYSFMGPGDVKPFAESLEGGDQTSIQAMTEASSASGLAIVWGHPLLRDGALYNGQSIALPGKGVVATYSKANQWGNDYLWCTPGEESPPIVSYKGKKIGLLICRDIRDKSETLSDIYEPGDADVVAFSSNFGRGAFPATAWMEFAKNNQVVLAVSNRYGIEEHNDFGPGGVCVIYPDGVVACEGLKWSAPCIVYSKV